MSIDQRSLPNYLSNDADFRTWGQGIAAQLAAIGLVKTTDTGQINWATAIKPNPGGASTAYAGYEIWRFNDALQATKPVFIKLEYGSFGGAGQGPALRATVSTATNGAGTPTGIVGTAREMVNTGGGGAGTTLPSYCSGSPSRLNLCANLHSTSAVHFLMLLVERTKTAAGVDTGDGIVTYSIGGWGTPPPVYQFMPFSTPLLASSTTNPAPDLSTAGQANIQSGADYLLSPTIIIYGGIFFASWCPYKSADLTGQSSITFDHLGATRTYMPLGEGVKVSSGTHTLSLSTLFSLAMLWE